MNISAIDKIYNYLSGEKEYVDLPETEDARKKVKAYAMSDLFSADDEEALNNGLDQKKSYQSLAWKVNARDLSMDSDM